ncbi:cytochrome c oxidase subunit 4 [Brevibacterium linens]|uniref:Cytochrome c oxidase polypeptide 4 n=2 Tax=Brevibacterium linens TaxID=1703 RepID=A0A2H1HR32_BRELN|nr:cytochrome c oxidase subunit 4 [Brevibacterium linens]KAB1947636.1 cytochrome c oxidase subunit 4 [Brevibacterium linens ATCC 9172]SMX65393.1 Cytochrome c oxidase subunit IV [Brevibacterium linens]SMX88831.1 Cytochrome c oxidase subunit IV [Brevibacterium linens ATCC 9172]
MKSSIYVFNICGLFFIAVGIFYGVFTDFTELVGFPALLLVGLMALMIGVYLWLTDRRVGRQPQDNDDAEISEADADYGFFSPWSWWPITSAAAAAVAFYGIAMGWWIFPFGVVLGIVALVGLTYEHDRGDFAH